MERTEDTPEVRASLQGTPNRVPREAAASEIRFFGHEFHTIEEIQNKRCELSGAGGGT